MGILTFELTAPKKSGLHSLPLQLGLIISLLLTTFSGAGAQEQPVTPKSASRRTITNSDLEPYRKKRLESEKAYRKEREELSLPSEQDSQRQNEEEQRWLNDFAAREEVNNAQSAVLQAHANAFGNSYGALISDPLDLYSGYSPGLYPYAFIVGNRHFPRLPVLFGRRFQRDFRAPGILRPPVRPR